jgi:hypothetical protein
MHKAADFEPKPSPKVLFEHIHYNGMEEAETDDKGLVGDELFLNSDRTGAHHPSSRPAPLQTSTHHVMSSTHQNKNLEMELAVQQNVLGAEHIFFGRISIGGKGGVTYRGTRR